MVVVKGWDGSVRCMLEVKVGIQSPREHFKLVLWPLEGSLMDTQECC